MKKRPVIAIDGPAGAGKSTVARIVARELGFVYADTGALFRALTWKALRDRVNLHDPRALADLASRARIGLSQDSRTGAARVTLDGEDVTGRIRSERVSLHTNEIAKVKSVRRILASLERRMGRNGGLGMEGPDIGTRIFPRAEFKFYLDASPGERAKRRHRELKKKGKRIGRRKIPHALAQRDYKDKNRGISPLRMAQDAVVIDSTRLSLEEAARRILGRIRGDAAR